MNPLTRRLINLTGALVNAMKENSVPASGKGRYWFECLEDSEEQLKEILEEAKTVPLPEVTPKWVVNNKGELGVEVNGRFFFMYKGDAIEYDDSVSMYWRPVAKREFGESCRVDELARIDVDTFVSDSGAHDWYPLPRPSINHYL